MSHWTGLSGYVICGKRVTNVVNLALLQLESVDIKKDVCINPLGGWELRIEEKAKGLMPRE